MSSPPLRRRMALAAALAGLLVIAFDSHSAGAGTSTTFSGSATVISGYVTAFGQTVPVNVVQAGPIPSSGGSAHNCLLAYPNNPDCQLQTVPDQTNGAITTEVLGARAVGQGSHSHASASTVSLNVDLGKLAGTPLPPLAVSFLDAEANAVCQAGVATASGATQVVGVTLGGTSIDPTLGSVTVGPVTILFNQVSIGPNGTGGQQADAKALEIIVSQPGLPASTDLVIGSAHADITCGSTGVPQGGCSDKLTGGGWYQVPTGTAHFALAGSAGDPTWGHLVYSDDATGLKFHGRPDYSLLVDGPTGSIPGSSQSHSSTLTAQVVQGAAVITGTNVQPFTLGGVTYNPGDARFVAVAIDNGEGHNSLGDVVGVVIFDNKTGNVLDHTNAEGSAGVLTSLDGLKLGGGNVQYHDCK